MGIRDISLFGSDDTGDEWTPCRLINDSKPVPGFEPPRWRISRDGSLQLTGHCEGGALGNPQIQVPPFAIAHLRDKLIETYPPGPVIDFDTGEITFDGVRV